jgi:probable addiction module antidote protein
MAKTKPFDTAEYLDSPRAIADYLSEAFETADPDFISKAIGTVARAVGMTTVAKEAGLSRENLYRALGTEAKPEFDTVMKVITALGVRLSAKPNETRPARSSRRAVHSHAETRHRKLEPHM